jgi:uncharacterized glyoxalase superfamily protein PhnB
VEAAMPDWRPSLIPAVFYKDPKAALVWLEKAFGFELFMLIEDAAGELGHAEMRHGDAVIMVGGEWSQDHVSAASTGGRNTQTVHIGVSEDIHAHYARARAAGAEILMEPADQFYGAVTYRCRDLEGHIWTVAQHVRDVSREEAEAVSGMKITGWI